MKRIDLTKTGGFPMKQKTLAYLQDGHFAILKAMIGHFGLSNTGSHIIFGCDIAGANITPGMMYIDGVLCPFAGAVGNLTTKIAMIETTGTAGFKNGSNPVIYFEYTAAENTAGVALSNFIRLPKVPELANVATAWADITGKPNFVIDPAVAPAPSLIDRILKLEEQNKIFQAGGGMVLWNKPANLIPTNWREVADWKGRIPVGVDDRLNGIGQLENPEFAPLPPTNPNDLKTPGRVGGSKTHKLTQAELPNYDLKRGVAIETPSGGNEVIWSSAPGGSHQQIINSGGGDQPHTILNPYRTVLFIEYIG
jgi:hypothetical protein